MADLIPFDDSYIPEPNSGCWLWLRVAGGHGYGMVWQKTGFRQRRLVLAHRWSWFLHRGPIPVGMHVLHKCDVPLCVNPDHLFIGTNADNMADMHRKGRYRPCRGINKHNAKLTEEQVLEIRSAMGLHKDVAARFGVDPTTASRIRRGKRWRHVGMRQPEGAAVEMEG